LLPQCSFFTEKQEKLLQQGKVSYESQHRSQLPRTLFITKYIVVYTNIFQKVEQKLACTEEGGNSAFPSDMTSP